jgi:hypothetical protein
MVTTRIQINNNYLDVYHPGKLFSSLSEYMILRHWFTHNQTKKIIEIERWKSLSLFQKCLFTKFEIKIKILTLLKRGLKR